jgi:hypothetical protein
MAELVVGAQLDVTAAAQVAGAVGGEAMHHLHY